MILQKPKKNKLIFQLNSVNSHSFTFSDNNVHINYYSLPIQTGGVVY